MVCFYSSISKEEELTGVQMLVLLNYLNGSGYGRRMMFERGIWASAAFGTSG